ncbi:hypothetical protein HY031_02040 [Candidatus Gottesmanbacteria bacterium]|nr:hypothetical protein [Candidatus Gottesmanbacteria bacterium]
MKIVQFLVSVLLFSFLVTPVAAVTTSQGVATLTPTPTKVDYALPYPGILPDNPLYFLKAIRDRILDFLIVDPAKKAEFYVLQADKRLGMGAVLFEQGKAQLSEDTVSKGEKYLVQALGSAQSLKNSGKEIPGYLLDRLTKSAAKHEEILKELVAKATGKDLVSFQESLILLQKTIADIAGLK